MKDKMNPKLQKIFDIIQQSDKLDAEQKEALLNAVKDADKELEITAFKLERTEKVKKTTAILLEETIEELEQKRKAVEAQNRELEIEGSLERVRAQAMAMRKPADLSGIAEKLFTELKALNFPELRNTEIIINNDSKETVISYYYSDYGVSGIIEVDYKTNPLVQKWANDMRNADDAFTEIKIPESEMEAWRAYRESLGYLPDPKLNEAPEVFYYSYSTGLGALSVSTFKPVSEEQIKILERFRNVFKLSYQRYKDIEQAEAQAREAQIEAALERVRSRTMGMQKSEELLSTRSCLIWVFRLMEAPLSSSTMILQLSCAAGGQVVPLIHRRKYRYPILISLFIPI